MDIQQIHPHEVQSDGERFSFSLGEGRDEGERLIFTHRQRRSDRAGKSRAAAHPRDRTSCGWVFDHSRGPILAGSRADAWYSNQELLM